MLENIRISLRGIWSHKLRSLLTMLGIIIGIAAIIAIVSTIMGTNEQIKNNLIGSGHNTVRVQLYQDSWPADFSYQEPPANVPYLDDAVVSQLRDLPDVESAARFHLRSYIDNLFYLNTSLSGSSVYGISPEYLECAGMGVVAGRGFGSADYAGFHKVALIDKTVRSAAFGSDDPLGKTIDVSGTPFVVVGVVAMHSEFEPTINTISDYNLYNGSNAGSVYIPDALWPTVFRYDEPSSFLIRAVNTDAMTGVGRSTSELLNGLIGAGEGSTFSYRSNDLAEEAAQLQQLASSTNAMLIGIASISLLVGGIGVMNIMLVSVTERTREIGLKKALGARRRTIRMQFLTEAVLLSAIGGIIGVVAGIGLSHLIALVAGVPVMISPLAVLIAVLFSMAVGIVFGLVPSVKASNLNPIDALRYE